MLLSGAASCSEAVPPPPTDPEPLWRRERSIGGETREPVPIEGPFSARMIDFNFAIQQPASLCYLSLEIFEGDQSLGALHLRYDGALGENTAVHYSIGSRRFRARYLACDEHAMRVEFAELPFQVP